MKTIESPYLKRKVIYEKLVKKQTESINFISALRLIVFIAAIGCGFFSYTLKKYYFFALAIILFAILFIILLNKHSRLKYNRKCSTLIGEINGNSLKRLKGEWKSFEDTGSDFLEEDHSYSKDLDIFGKGSLFQYINTASTYLGREKLKHILTASNYTIGEIYDRQKAVEELSDNLGWRQRFIAEGQIAVEKKKNPESLFKWAKEKNSLFSSSAFIIMAHVLPIITVTVILLYFLLEGIPYYLPLMAIGVQVIILKINSKKSNKILDGIYKYKKDIEAYDRMLKVIEKKRFESSYLIKLKENLVNENKITATKQINKLSRLVNLISDRANFFYHIVNSITLWEYHCLIRLEAWKKESGLFIEQWLDVIAEIEGLSSLAVINHDYPHWVMPELKNSSLIIEGKNIGHPLITKNRVCNDLKIDNTESILLITGSNMSGKSTLLRTIGINLVLAYAGAPVCAEAFCCSIMNIYTCMRISDNLEENISSFYAELLRIRKLIDATKEKEPVFFLLDEIFRGTNSKDRHTGARVLIEKLSRENALGMVSTHDLELADIEEKNRKVRNYHFREYYKNNEIYFDYKLRLGVSTTRNAIYLMRMAGIDIDNNMADRDYEKY
ncbi:DNA mismatch repair protein [Clostridium sp. CX1]|uniref:MutS family DNA mismatch repair protein n=1 Tax=Clostridium sp. CX1 TaxID=2978346 RepID=UPI0021BFCCA5|nr:MutS family DNA mismatch repair protein [Clostridium sp. CX1]MCT8977050.1 DNA mismatch repair protein [Clostridium sp. CX1]